MNSIKLELCYIMELPLSSSPKSGPIASCHSLTKTKIQPYTETQNKQPEKLSNYCLQTSHSLIHRLKIIKRNCISNVKKSRISWVGISTFRKNGHTVSFRDSKIKNAQCVPLFQKGKGIAIRSDFHFRVIINNQLEHIHSYIMLDIFQGLLIFHTHTGEVLVHHLKSLCFRSVYFIFLFLNLYRID